MRRISKARLPIVTGRPSFSSRLSVGTKVNGPKENTSFDSQIALFIIRQNSLCLLLPACRLTSKICGHFVAALQGEPEVPGCEKLTIGMPKSLKKQGINVANSRRT